MLYTVKYAPKKLDELLGNEDRVAHVKNWVLQWLSGKKRKPLLLWGPPGIGKTTMAYAIKQEFDLDLLELNASELRNRERVERITHGASLAGGLFGRGRLVLIDDADVLAGRADSGGSGAITDFLRESPCPTIVTATDVWDKKLAPIRNECEIVELKRVSKVSIRKLLAHISSNEKLGLSAEAIGAMADNSHGDVRAALNDLQALTPTVRDTEKDIFTIVRDILKAETYAAAKEAVRGDIDYDFIKLWIDENIPLEYETVADIAAAYDSLSKADIFDGRIKKQKWQLLKYSIDLATAGVALAKARPYHKFTRYNFPSYLRNMSRSMERRAMLKAIGAKLGARLHTGRKAALYYLPLIKEYGKAQPEAVMDFYGLDEEQFAFIMETSVSRVKRD
ncbi:MAG: replication factor C large subunit [Candidatus ainarchaeum sp.]|nr:replication factor C large subunit [Candidatus ainarchaeum sp.]